MQPLYLDHASTTPPAPEVIAAITEVLTDDWGNPSSHHRHGFGAAKKLKDARSVVAETLLVNPNEVYFTSGATESINLALRGYLTRHAGRHVIAPLTEHKAVLDTLKALERIGLIHVSWITPQNDGVVTTASIASHIRHDTCLIACMWVNNETGIINPIEEIGLLTRNENIPFFCDATQAFGKVPVNLTNHCDFAALSAHKIRGPKGVGGLWVRKSLQRELNALVTGGGQEDGLRAGTENLPGIVGFAKACELAVSQLEERQAHVATLKELTLKILGRELDAKESLSGLTVPHILSVTIPGIDNQILINQIRDVASISAGSACNSARHEPSHVLLASGLTEDLANSTIRLSFGLETTAHDLKKAVETLVMFAKLQQS